MKDTFVVYYNDGSIEYVDAYSIVSFKNGKVVFDIGKGKTISKVNVLGVEG